jgi:hypothetical protein
LLFLSETKTNVKDCTVNGKEVVYKLKCQGLQYGENQLNPEVSTKYEGLLSVDKERKDLREDMPRYRFLFLYFDLEILKSVQNSIALHTQIYLITNGSTSNNVPRTLIRSE